LLCVRRHCAKGNGLGAVIRLNNYMGMNVSTICRYPVNIALTDRHASYFTLASSLPAKWAVMLY
jgi:hypothetical protein